MTDINWQLFNSLKGAKEVSKKLTSALKKKISEAKKDIRKNHRDPLWWARKIRYEMYKIMGEFTAFGAYDSEPSIVLVTEIEQRLNLERDSLSRY
ncbi:hypothetical protein ACFL35_16845 [Candidatus Riflebacteria bacterium]